MINLDSVTTDAVVRWVLGIFAVLGLGQTARSINSRRQAVQAQDGAVIAKANAEKGIYETHTGSVEDDRDQWRKTAEEGWAKIESERLISGEKIKALELRMAKMERDMRHWRSEFALRLKFFKRQYPDVDVSWLVDSGPAPLDVSPEPKQSDFGEFR